MHIEHIDPFGGNDSMNLCLSCANCNMSKARVTSARDSETGVQVPLFNPRLQIWQEHFEWIDEGLRLLGKTPTGRATILRLKMNREPIITARRNWIAAGTHPR
jgi:hypothetical protein